MELRHTVLGVIGIFIYVGIEIGIPGTLNFYLADSTERSWSAYRRCAIGGAIAAIYWLLMLVGRLAEVSVISGKVSSRVQLITVSIVAICFILIAIFEKEVKYLCLNYSADNGFQMASGYLLSILFLVLCGLCTSIMGGIFNLAVEGLGKYTAQASGIFMRWNLWWWESCH